MKKTILTLVLLTLTHVASAQEHRGHTLDKLEIVSHHLASAEKDIATHLQFYDPSYFHHVGPLAEANLRQNGASAITWIANSQDKITSIMAALPGAEAFELEGFRRDSNQPHTTDTDRSLLLGIAIAMDYTLLMSGSHIRDPNTSVVKPSANLRQALHNLQQAWRIADQADWHINDAIYQEVYGAE